MYIKKHKRRKTIIRLSNVMTTIFSKILNTNDDVMTNITIDRKILIATVPKFQNFANSFFVHFHWRWLCCLPVLVVESIK